MSDKERLQSELAIAEVVEEYEALRPVVYGDDAAAAEEARPRFKELAKQISDMRGEHKATFQPDPGGEGDAMVSPGAIESGIDVSS